MCTGSTRFYLIRRILINETKNIPHREEIDDATEERHRSRACSIPVSDTAKTITCALDNDLSILISRLYLQQRKERKIR